MVNKDMDYHITKDDIMELKISATNMISCVEINDFIGVERDLDTLIKDAILLKNYLNKTPNIHYYLGSLENLGRMPQKLHYPLEDD